MKGNKKGQLSPLLKQSTDVHVKYGQGCYLYDRADRRYLDFTSGIGVTSTGHCHPRVTEAAKAQVDRLIHGQFNTVLHEPIEELSVRLGMCMPGAIDSLYYGNSGAESIETALRLARHATGKPNVIVFHGSFHGRTMGALSMTTSSASLRAGVQPMMGSVIVAPFPHTFRYGWDEEATTNFCLAELDYILATYSAPEDTAAMFIEPIQGEGGFVPANTKFMAGLRERADQHNMLLVFDEIQAGYGRTGKFWSHSHFDVQPDILITAKGLASGFPLSAFGASTAIMEKGFTGSQGGTYAGNAVSCAAALATLDVIETEGLVDNAAIRGKELFDLLGELPSSHSEVADVRGKGLMCGLEFYDDQGNPDATLARKVVNACEMDGLLVLRCAPHKNVVRLLPPLIVTAQQVHDAVDILKNAISTAA